MERGLSLLIATVIIFVASGVQAQNNNTQLNITRMGCGVSKLCIETPTQCDPAGNSSCLFTSVTAGNTTAQRGTDLSFQLSGNSTGFIAVGLSAGQGNALAFVCGQNSSTNGSFFFRAGQLNSTGAFLPPPVNQTVTFMQGRVSSNNKIQCVFTVPGLNATSMTRIDSSTVFSVLLASGTVNGNTLGSFSTVLVSAPLNIANPSANAPTTAAPTNTNVTANATANANATTTVSTTGAAVTHHLHAMTLLLGFLTLCVMMLF